MSMRFIAEGILLFHVKSDTIHCYPFSLCTRGLTILIYLVYCYKKVDSISSKKIKIRHKCNIMIIYWKKGKFTCDVKNYFVSCRKYMYCVWLLEMYTVLRISRNLTWLHKSAFMAHQLINHFTVTLFRSALKVIENLHCMQK